MSHTLQFYIDGAWVDSVAPHPFDVIDPSNEEAFAQISLGSKADVDMVSRTFSKSRVSSATRRLEVEAGIQA